MNWYEWETLELFNTWHDALCVQLDYPIYGINEATGEIDNQSQPTTTYTSPFEVSGKIVAIVADVYAQGLTQSDLRPAKPSRPNEA